ncbi:MAG: glutathione S-transferase family protein [Alphaproteobacteria bacterium]|nr:glutathione S-transferase family protein [Alphaproteobacteria bacterium]MDE2340245.1 glutathione S-transferase family protein [Alphaproteobacteria bacterium]
MADSLIFYTNPQSRGQIIRWMLEELGAPYETVLLDYATTMKGAEYRAINPMGKVPAIAHNGRIVTESAAICAYLADAYPDAGLAPPPGERAEYYRWMFFAAGPIEAAFSNKAMGWEAPPERQRMFGYGTFELAISTIETAIKGKAFIAGDRFSAADVYVGSMLDFMINFKLLEPSATVTDYVGPLRERAAYKRAKAIDAALMPQPS